MIKSLLIANRGEMAPRIGYTSSVAVLALALVACGSEASEAAGKQNAKTVAASKAAACPTVKIDLTADRFDEGRANFAEGRPARERLSQNFAKAYAEACAAGWFSKKPLIDPRAERKDMLFLANAPEANVASIYFNDVAMVMEGPFVDSAEHVQIPGPDAIKEAIYCYAVGATEDEQVESGRCLVD